MIPDVISRASIPDDVCRIARKWGISDELSERLHLMASRVEVPFSIISGLRTAAQQAALRASGRPAASDALSTHLSCPATGADIRPSIAVTRLVKARLGAEGVHAGLRWGGGSQPDSGGIPSDWNHFDLGPRHSP